MVWRYLIRERLTRTWRYDFCFLSKFSGWKKQDFFGYRVFCSRANSDFKIVDQPHPNKAKGFQACFLGEAGEKMSTVGWNADKRDLALWDARNLGTPITRVV
jgi:hypothetical protein